VKPALYAALVLAGFFLAGLASFWLAVRPPRLSVPLRPEDYRLTVETVTIRAVDGVGLAGWFAPRPGAPAIVFLHGYPAEKADLLPLAAALAPEFAVLLVDHRYFGDSEGRATTLGFRERSDLRRVIDFLESRGVSAVGVFGLSLGGAVALLTAAEDPRIRAVAAYAPFADLKALGQELYAWMWLARYPFVETMLLWSRLVFGGDISRPTPAAAASLVRVPVLLVHSRQDEQIPFSHAERLRAALAGNPKAEFEFMARGRHGELPSGFEARLARFFREALVPARAAVDGNASKEVVS
jgi:pimeloyl-ACP methyl ester carboxylesterase